MKQECNFCYDQTVTILQGKEYGKLGIMKANCLPGQAISGKKLAEILSADAVKSRFGIRRVNHIRSFKFKKYSPVENMSCIKVSE